MVSIVLFMLLSSVVYTMEEDTQHRKLSDELQKENASKLGEILQETHALLSLIPRDNLSKELSDNLPEFIEWTKRAQMKKEMLVTKVTHIQDLCEIIEGIRNTMQILHTKNVVSHESLTRSDAILTKMNFIKEKAEKS